MIEAYPLTWPIGQPRTARPVSSNFGSYTLTQVTGQVLYEIKQMQGLNAIISTNIPLRKDGLPRADYLRRSITDYGAAVYFNYNEKPVVLACDKWDTIEDNLRAVAKSIEAMRGLGRWGVSEIMERAFTGFIALPEHAATLRCFDVLGIGQTKNKQEITDRYKSLAKERHPNNGGSDDLMTELNLVYQDALKYAE